MIWKVLNLAWGKYRIIKMNGAWSVIYDGGTIHQNILTLIEAKRKAEQYECMRQKSQSNHAELIKSQL